VAGADQVQAPVIEIAQQQQRLIARSEAGTGWSGAVQAAQVHTVLTAAEAKRLARRRPARRVPGRVRAQA